MSRLDITAGSTIVVFFSDRQEELAEGLHLIDFEQLKIENQTYNEKIEERNEVRRLTL